MPEFVFVLLHPFENRPTWLHRGCPLSLPELIERDQILLARDPEHGIWRIINQLAVRNPEAWPLIHPALREPLPHQVVQHIVNIPNDGEHPPIQYVTNVLRFAFALIAESL